MKYLLHKTLPVLALALVSTSVWAGGALDTTFNGSGKKKIDMGHDDYAGSAVQQADGKLVMTGDTYDSVANTRNIAVVRLNATGSLDTTFNGTGKKIIDLGGMDYASTVIQQADGKLVLAGESLGTGEKMAVVRLNANGSFDTTFNGTGKLKLNLGGDSNALSAIQQADGKLVLAGYIASSSGGQDFVVVRLSANGTLDTTFNGSGIKKIDFGGGLDSGHSIIQQADGKLVVAGETFDMALGSSDMGVARLNTDGTVDTAFGTGGKKKVDLGASESAFSVIQQSNGKLVLAGQTYNGTIGAFDMVVVRLNAAGGLDTTFNTTGKKVINMGGNEYAQSVVQQSDGKLVVAGTWISTAGDASDMVVLRLNSGGGFDSNFATGGKKKIDVGGYEYANAVLLQSDGNIVVAGRSQNVATGISDFAVARLLP